MEIEILVKDWLMDFYIPGQSWASQNLVWQVEGQLRDKPGCKYFGRREIQSVDEHDLDFNQRVTCSHKVGSNKKTIGGLSGTCKKLWPADPGTLFKYVIAWYNMVLYDLQLHWYYKVILSDWRHLKKSNWPGSWPCCRAAGSSAAYSWSQTYSIVVTAWIKPIQ